MLIGQCDNCKKEGTNMMEYTWQGKNGIVCAMCLDSILFPCGIDCDAVSKTEWQIARDKHIDGFIKCLDVCRRDFNGNIDAMFSQKTSMKVVKTPRFDTHQQTAISGNENITIAQ